MKSLDINKITDNKTFWRTIVPSSTKKKDVKISNDKKLRRIFNKFFSNVVSSLEIPSLCNYFSEKKHTFSFNYIFLILKIRNLIQFFHSKKLLK